MNSIVANGDMELRAARMSLSGMPLRVLSAVILALPVLAAVWIGSPAFDLLLVLAALVMAWEWDRLLGASRMDVATWTLAGSTAIIVGAAVVGWYAAAFASIVLGGGALYAVARRVRGSSDPLLLAAGVGYIGLPVIALLWLRDDALYGLASILFLFAVVWSTDIGALFVGRAVGGPKLAPSISPNKTWAGFYGGLLAAVLVGALAGLWHGAAGLLPLMSIAAVLSIVSQAGDLLESRIKRYRHVKDSGDIIPGHGGIFDRVDALLTAGPALALVYLIAGGGAFLWR